MAEEKIIVANLSAALRKPATKRGRCAMNVLRIIAARHAKALVGMVRISPAVSQALWDGDYHNPVKTIKVKLVAGENIVKVMLPNETEAIKKDEKKEKTTEKKAVPEKSEKHVGGERKAPGEEAKEEKTESDIVKEKERKDLQKMKK